MHLQLGMALVDPVQGALNLYNESEKAIVNVDFKKIRLPVEVAFIPREEMEYHFPGEKYAATTSGRFFIFEGLLEEYRPFAVFHELAEHAAPRGFDVTGLAAHYQALTLELGYAKATLPSQEFMRYLKWRKKVERSRYFRFEDREGLVDKIALSMEEIFRAIPPFLTYRNELLLELKALENS